MPTASDADRAFEWLERGYRQARYALVAGETPAPPQSPRRLTVATVPAEDGPDGLNQKVTPRRAGPHHRPHRASRCARAISVTAPAARDVRGLCAGSRAIRIFAQRDPDWFPCSSPREPGTPGTRPSSRSIESGSRRCPPHPSARGAGARRRVWRRRGHVPPLTRRAAALRVHLRAFESSPRLKSSSEVGDSSAARLSSVPLSPSTRRDAGARSPIPRHPSSSSRPASSRARCRGSPCPLTAAEEEEESPLRGVRTAHRSRGGYPSDLSRRQRSPPVRLSSRRARSR